MLLIGKNSKWSDSFIIVILCVSEIVREHSWSCVNNDFYEKHGNIYWSDRSVSKQPMSKTLEKCSEVGGYPATINTQEEFDTVKKIASITSTNKPLKS